MRQLSDVHMENKKKRKIIKGEDQVMEIRIFNKPVCVYANYRKVHTIQMYINTGETTEKIK